MLKLIKKYMLIFLLLSAIGNLMVFVQAPKIIFDLKLIINNCVFSILVGFPIMKANELAMVYISKKMDWKDKPIKKFIISLITLILVTTLMLIIIEIISRVISGKGLLFHDSNSAFNLMSFQVIFLVYIFTFITGVEFFRMWKEGLIKQESLQRKAVELQLKAIKKYSGCATFSSNAG